MALAVVASQGLCISGLEKTCSSSLKLTQQLSITKMSRESSSACNKDVKVVHAAEPVKKKSASAAAGENGGVAA